MGDIRIKDPRFFRFINSPDFREHLRKIRYEFSPIEAAWLVCQCRSATLKEKHAAWQEIIDTMPDCCIEPELDDTPNRLHEYLREYMKKQDELTEVLTGTTAESFCGSRSIMPGLEEDGKMTHNTHPLEARKPAIENGAVYRLRIRDRKTGDWFDCDGQYSTFEACLSAAASEKEIDRIQVCRQFPDDTKGGIAAELRPDGELLSVEEKCPSKARSVLYDGFNAMYFTFPAPFQKGDIVHDPEECGLWSGPFVLIETEEDHPKHPCGCFQDADSGELYSYTMFSYVNCEYYRGDLSGKRRLLTVLSNCIKEKIDVCAFARAYHRILLEEAAKDSMTMDTSEE